MGTALGLGSGPWLRTWLWVDRILDRYADLNRARRDAFHGWGWAHAPASTAVGVELALGGAMAWEALGTDAPARRIESIGRQPAARSYGAVFARAGIVDLDGGRLVLVSGTAAIGDDGTTLHPHDAPAQIAATLDQVAQIRAATGTEAGTLIHTTVYLPDGAADDAWRAMAGSVPWPVLAVRADVCRPDLRFEIETIAILPRGNPG
jgi:enamine deaminase RidA (YjgF/YER057c/UK114 family)